MKINIKKTMLIIAACVGIASAMNTQAQQKVKVYVGPFNATASVGRASKTLTGSVDEMCNQMVEFTNEVKKSPQNPSYYQYTGVGKISTWIPGNFGHWSGGGNPGWLSCNVYSIKISNGAFSETSIGGGVSCDKGLMYEYFWDGCYEEQNTCPENTVANDDGICEAEFKCPEGTEPAPQTRSGTVNEGVMCVKPEFPPNDARCNGRSRAHLGGVACDSNLDKDKSICFWSEKLKSTETDPIARKQIYLCVVEHEKVHRYDSTGVCDKMSGRISFYIPNGNLSRAEIKAYNTEISCLSSSISVCDESNEPEKCVKQIMNRISSIKSERDTHRNKLGL